VWRGRKSKQLEETGVEECVYSGNACIGEFERLDTERFVAAEGFDIASQQRLLVAPRHAAMPGWGLDARRSRRARRRAAAEFAAARDELAARLRGEGNEAAAAVKKMRKPAVTQWVVQ
jgi:hypothetical protein